MRKLSLAIVDDERSARDLIKSLLEDEAWIEILWDSSNVEDALSNILKKRPDVLLLDIEMPRNDGFVLIEKLAVHAIRLEVIFITAYEKFALKAIKASAFDYLLKPVKKSELTASLEKVLLNRNSIFSDKRFESLLDQMSVNRKLKFRSRAGFSIVAPEEIVYCQAESNYSVLELDSGKSITVSMNLGKVEEMLPEEFFCRISRSTIVNLQYLTQVDRRTMTCELLNETVHKLNISRKYLKLLELSCDNLATK